MTISTDGIIRWIPVRTGTSYISVAVGDGQATVYQNFTITVANRPPKVTSTPVTEVIIESLYCYNVTAIDDDKDPLLFTLIQKPENMIISLDGRITWIPTNTGTFNISVAVSDGQETIKQDFIINVLPNGNGAQNHVPGFTGIPITTATTGLPYSYDAIATDADNDTLLYSLATSPAGMTIDASSGKIAWTPAAAGNQMVRIKVGDGKGGEAYQEFVVTVLERVKASVQFTTPSEGQKVKGKLAVTGSAVKGTLDIVKVQIRIDSSDWTDAIGNETWSYTLDTTKLKNGKHTLQARAFDGMDYSDIANRTITVDNQKAAGKGFIPGFAGIIVPVVVAAACVLLGWRRKANR